MNKKEQKIRNISRTKRIVSLREKTFSNPRYMSVDQAKIITRVYRDNDSSPVNLKRAMVDIRKRLRIVLPIPGNPIVYRRGRGWNTQLNVECPRSWGTKASNTIKKYALGE